MNSEILKIAGAIALPQIGGLICAYLALPEMMGWYQRLNFPPIVPPNWVFPPVWTILNAGIGYASYLVWQDGGGFNGTARLPLILYGIQLALNWAWTPIFYKLHKLKWSFFESLVHAGAVAATGFAFFDVNKIAGYLVIPYFAWCSFASLLNFEIYRRNPQESATIEETTEGN
uniref:Putative peripheral-type benzodiazepine receptor n=1 Tax=Culex tarsalis TaxID=7177 RepID=A0A1Q3FSZ2_CULTA